MLMNRKNFDFTEIPDKNNDVIFLKSPKTLFLGHFWPFLPNGDFFQKIQLSRATIYVSRANPKKTYGQKKEGQADPFL